MSVEVESSHAQPEWASSLIGSRLTGVKALTFFTPDHIRTENFQFQLEIDQGEAWTVLSGCDGESISLRRGIIDPAEATVVANLGYLKIVDETSPEFALALHKSIKSATSFLESGVLIGIRLATSDGTFLAIFNAGDKLVLLVNKELPLKGSEDVGRLEHKR